MLLKHCTLQTICIPLVGVIVVQSEELVSEAVTPRHVALATEMVVQTPHTPPHHPTNPLLLTPLARHRGNMHSCEYNVGQGFIESGEREVPQDFLFPEIVPLCSIYYIARIADS